jgi:valyl-tRNA synthetase
MLGDTAVAVNPKDKKYKKLVGQKVIVPLVNREIPVIADEAVELGFGTGAVKVTPAHDPVDFEIGERHKLEKIQVIDQRGKMTEAAGKDYVGLKVEEARAKVVADLQSLGLIEKIEPYKHSASVCYKCNRAIEPLVLPQWFIKMQPLAKKAMEAVKKGEVKFVTKRFEKIFFHWLKNIRDWNISRQIVWGIRMPVWYQGDKIHIGEEAPASGEWKQETDVFDTWFSSGQWPFAVLKTTGDFDKFYPTAVMETGWDILFFWVARMIMLGIYATGKSPFSHVYLHGLIRDKDRQKMSKSKGNVIDPLGVVELYGADALRMALVFGVSAGNDVVISEDKIKAHRNFANKIWNASRFVLAKLGDDFKPDLSYKKTKNADDKEILKALEQTTKKMTKCLDKFEFHLAAESGYQFFWHNFCDKHLEAVKSRLPGFGTDAPSTATPADQEMAKQVLYKVLSDSLKLLHPFMPYVTEAIYQEMPAKKDYLIVESWPK